MRLPGYTGCGLQEPGIGLKTSGGYSRRTCYAPSSRIVRVYFDTGVFIDYLSTRGNPNPILRSSERGAVLQPRWQWTPRSCLSVSAALTLAQPRVLHIMKLKRRCI